MKIKLLSLEIKNFQGCKELAVEPDGEDMLITGENETGKTTIFNAFYWLFFNKNAKGQSTQKFDIKPLDEDNEPIHGLETTVKGTLQVDDSQLTLEKIYKEVWRKKRGSNEKKFDGHTTDYYVSGAPVKKSEYEERIAELGEEKLFKLLTDPLYFNTQLHWRERRDILLQLQEITDEDIFNEDEKLKEVTEILIEDDVEKTKKALREKMNRLNDNIEQLPVRIDEVNENLPDVSELDWKEIEQEITDLKAEKKEKEQELARASEGGAVAEKKKKVSELETEMLQIKNSYTAKYEKKIAGAKEKRTTAEDDLREIRSEIKQKKRDKKDISQEIKSAKNKIEKLKNKWYELQEEKEQLQAKEFPKEEHDTCPTCNRPLPPGQIEEARQQFNQRKAEEIEELIDRQREINRDGKQIEQHIGELEKTSGKIDREIEKLQKKAADLEEQIDKIKDEINELQDKGKAYKKDFEYQKKQAEIKSLKEQIEKLQKGNSDELKSIEAEINELEIEIEYKQNLLSQIKSYNRGQKRIDELKDKEEELAEKYEELERQYYLCEQYEKTRAELLEDQVNDLFELAEFKLFEEQINGGIKPTCQTLHKGVPYNTGLNDGNRILVGLDIINTLSEHFDFRAPVFIDNCESVTHELESESQLIKLKAVEGVEELNIKEAV
ncbi:MAG: AAA family ATPase [Bacteroidota bacterium]